jgi:tRNA threonylcarbamoyladenosine modification (KEOPS) complex  Pcc1 subunit
MCRLTTPIESRLEINFSSSETAKAVLQALSPDNKDVPNGIDIQTMGEQQKLTVLVKTNNVGSMVATLEDIFQCIQAAETTLKEVI